MARNFREELSEELSEDQDEEYTILKVRGKTLAFGNVIYQISNIASIGLFEKIKPKPLPIRAILLLPLSIVLTFISSSSLKVLGIVSILVSLFFIYRYCRKIKKIYYMTIHTNAGDKRRFFSRNKSYVTEVILELYQVMNSEEQRAINFNFKNCHTNRSVKHIKIDKNTNSPIVDGDFNGKVVDLVE